VKAKKIGKVLDGSDLLLSHAINPSLLYLLDYFTQRSFFATTLLKLGTLSSSLLFFSLYQSFLGGTILVIWPHRWIVLISEVSLM
jgi:hypothetical protein